MQKITNAADLHDAIAQLEGRRAEEWSALKAQAHQISESLRPANVSKRILKNLLTASSAENGLIDETIGVATGIAAKKLITIGSRNPLVHLLGSLAEKIVSGTVSQHAGGIKELAAILFRKLIALTEKNTKE